MFVNFSKVKNTFRNLKIKNLSWSKEFRWLSNMHQNISMGIQLNHLLILCISLRSSIVGASISPKEKWLYQMESNIMRSGSLNASLVFNTTFLLTLRFVIFRLIQNPFFDYQVFVIYGRVCVYIKSKEAPTKNVLKDLVEIFTLAKKI